MKFIEVRDGLYIRKEEILAVEQKESGSTIFTEAMIFDSNFPCSTIVSLLEMDNIEEKVANKPIDNLWGVQHWAG